MKSVSRISQVLFFFPIHCSSLVLVSPLVPLTSLDHYKFHYISTLPTKYKLPGRSDIARRVRSSGLLPFTKLFGLSSEDYARNVINRSFIRKVKTHTVGPHHAAEDFICREFPTTESVLAAARAYIAEEFACEPRFRTSIRKIVADGAVLSTMPTKIGRREIDMHHRFASVKRSSFFPSVTY